MGVELLRKEATVLRGRTNMIQKASSRRSRALRIPNVVADRIDLLTYKQYEFIKITLYIICSEYVHNYY